MASIQGKTVVTQIGTSYATLKDLICEITNTASLNRETNSVTTKCDNGTTTLALGAYSFSVSGDAVADTAPTANQVTYKELLSWFVAGTALYAQITSGNSGANYYWAGNVYITQLDLVNEVNGVSQFTFTLSGTGALDISW